MGKDSAEKKLKKEKKEKKEKRAEADGVSKKEKKKDKKSKLNGEVAEALEKELEKGADSKLINDVTDVVMQDGDDDVKGAEAPQVVTRALVPFAVPLAEEPKEVKKILRTVKKSAKSKTLRRGVKEVVKALRKSPSGAAPSSDISNPACIVVIAADISPMDVISHIPVLCEEHNVPYIYVKSRAELGEASATKRPTSVVMVARDRSSKKSKDVKDDDKKEFEEAYADLIKVVQKASRGVRK